MSSTKSATRYSSYNSFSSTTTSSSTELKHPNPFLLRNTATTKSNDSSAIVKLKHEHNFTAMVKKFMQNKHKFNTKPNSADRTLPLMIVPKDVIAEDVNKKMKKKKSGISGLQNKLFGGGVGRAINGNETKAKGKALTEVKANTRTLAMVLRSESELLSLNKEHESHISQLQSLLNDRTLEVEKLKDLCLQQREEIKALKSAILFPDEMNSQLHGILDKQGSELNQAKHVIPSLQRQISSLTGQLQCLSEDLAEVKAAKYTGRTSDGSFTSPMTAAFNQELEEAADSLDFSSDDLTMPNSPDNFLLKDVNPCLTPIKSKLQENDAMGYGYTKEENKFKANLASRKLSRSSDQFRILASESSTDDAFCRSDEGKYRYLKKLVDRHIL